jgi:hypothetical protein
MFWNRDRARAADGGGGRAVGVGVAAGGGAARDVFLFSGGLVPSDDVLRDAR